MADEKAIHDFLINYFEDSNGQKERKTYKRLREAFACVPGLTEEETHELAVNVYKAYTGKSPYYYTSGCCSLNQNARNKFVALIQDMVKQLPSEPISFTDFAKIYQVQNRGFVESLHIVAWYTIAENVRIRSIFKELGKAGLINMIEVRTCDRCHIRLFMAK